MLSGNQYCIKFGVGLEKRSGPFLEETYDWTLNHFPNSECSARILIPKAYYFHFTFTSRDFHCASSEVRGKGDQHSVFFQVWRY